MRVRIRVILAAMLGILFYTVSADARAASMARHPLSIRLDTVLSELAARNVGDLSEVRLANRDKLLEELARYRDIGEFPRNYDFPGERVPYFIDRKTGTRCAVAFLLESTGRGDVVQRVVATNNNVWVPQLAGDAEFTAWLDENGLTLAEAARIQVPYLGEMPAPQPAAQTSSSHRAYNIGSAAVIGASAASALWSARTGGRISKVSALTSGVAALGLGSVGLAGRDRSVGAVNMIAGSAAAYLATRSILRDRRIASAQREEQRVSVTPTVSVSDGAGVAVAFRF